MKRIGTPVDNLETPIQIEVTLRELLNIYATVATTSPKEVKNYLSRNTCLSEQELSEVHKAPIGIYKDDEGNDEIFVTYGLTKQSKDILMNYGISVR